MTKKYKAYQVSPDNQESYYNSDIYNELNISVTGNRDYCGHTTDTFDNVWKYYDDILDVVDNCYTSEMELLPDRWSIGGYNNLTEIMNDLLPKLNGKKYSTREIGKLKQAIVKYGNLIKTTNRYDEDILIIALLELMHSEPFECRIIRGYCQSDWQCVYYPVSQSALIKQLEIEYFNKGTEFCVTVDNEDFYVYCYDWGVDGMKLEIASHVGIDIEQIELYEFNGYYRTPKYRLMEV